MSLWKTLGKIGAIAGGGIATAMTGGAASPLLLAAIGAGTGATVGGIDNGWKGALTGGALGAATGGLGGGAASSMKSAGTSLGIGGAAKAALPGVLGVVGKTLSGASKGSEQSRLQQDNANAVRDRTASDAIADYERALEARSRLELDQHTLDNKTRDAGYGQTLRAQALQNWQPAQRPDRIPMVHGGFNTIPQASRDFAKDYEQQAMARALHGEKFNSLPAIERYKPTPAKEPSLWEKMSGALGLGLQGAGAITGLMKQNKIPFVGDAGASDEGDYA